MDVLNGVCQLKSLEPYNRDCNIPKFVTDSLCVCCRLTSCVSNGSAGDTLRLSGLFHTDYKEDSNNAPFHFYGDGIVSSNDHQIPPKVLANRDKI